MQNVNDYPAHPLSRDDDDPHDPTPGTAQEEARRWRQLVLHVQTQQLPFSDLVRELQPRLYRCIYLILWDAHDTWDVLQDVFLKLFRHLPTLDPRRNVRAFIYQTARNQAISQLRRKRLHRKKVRRLPSRGDDGSAFDPVDPRALDPLAQLANAEAAARQRLFYQQALQAFRRLKKTYRRVLYLFYVKDHSYDDLAARLGVAKTTIGPLLFRARKCFAERVEEAWRNCQEASR